MDMLIVNPQPPSGGCVLKPALAGIVVRVGAQPPSGGCVLKLFTKNNKPCCHNQPPSGGCVLKLASYIGALPNRPSRLRAAVC